MNAREYLEILHIAEKLKDTPRHCTTSNLLREELICQNKFRQKQHSNVEIAEK